MSKSLKSYSSEYERAEAITRRIAGDTKGLGYWASVDARKAEEKKKNNLKKVAKS